jgi:hypothetical protein
VASRKLAEGVRAGAVEAEANDGLVGALIKAGLRISKVAPPQDRDLSQQQLTRRMETSRLRRARQGSNGA